MEFQVIYSGIVRDRLTQFKSEAEAFGRTDGLRKALEASDTRFHRDPHSFGEPIRDLTWKKGQVRIAVMSPVAWRFVVIPEDKQVFVVWVTATFAGTAH